MIYLLHGENSYELEHALGRLVAAFDGEVERVDASMLVVEELDALLHARSLFATTRLVIIRQLSDNKPLWEALPEVCAQLDSDVTLILVEPRPDKRTKTYKALQVLVNPQQFSLWTERDGPIASEWVLRLAATRGLSMTTKQANYLVQRAGLNQWMLDQAIEKLSLIGNSDQDTIDQHIPRSPQENAYELLGAALSGNATQVHATMADLRQTSDPFQLFGLLSSQLTQLTSLVFATKSSQDVAKDIGAHPYVLAKLAPYAKQLSANDARQVLAWAADTDSAMKSTRVEPWVLVHTLLKKIIYR